MKMTPKSGKDGYRAHPPQTTRHAGPHRAVPERAAHAKPGILTMHRSAQAILLALTVVSTTAFAQAQDKVSLRYLPGYAIPSRSTEWVDVRVERMGSSSKAGEQEIDRFFTLVEATLSEYRILRDWQLVIPDAPSIEITVHLNGRRIRLASAHVPLEKNATHVVTERGLEALNQRTRDSVLSQQSEEFRRHRLAFERLLELTLQRTRARLSP